MLFVCQLKSEAGHWDWATDCLTDTEWMDKMAGCDAGSDLLKSLMIKGLMLLSWRLIIIKYIY